MAVDHKERGDRVEASRLSKSTMRVGMVLGVIAVLLLAFSPQIMGNFGTTRVIEGAPVAMAVSTTYLLVTATFLPFSAALVAASLIMRHAESLSHSKQT
jgi:hypothetical protein